MNHRLVGSSPNLRLFISRIGIGTRQANQCKVPAGAGNGGQVIGGSRPTEPRAGPRFCGPHPVAFSTIAISSVRP